MYDRLRNYEVILRGRITCCACTGTIDSSHNNEHFWHCARPGCFRRAFTCNECHGVNEPADVESDPDSKSESDNDDDDDDDNAIVNAELNRLAATRGSTALLQTSITRWLHPATITAVNDAAPNGPISDDSAVGSAASDNTEELLEMLEQPVSPSPECDAPENVDIEIIRDKEDWDYFTTLYDDPGADIERPHFSPLLDHAVRIERRHTSPTSSCSKATTTPSPPPPSPSGSTDEPTFFPHVSDLCQIFEPLALQRHIVRLLDRDRVLGEEEPMGEEQLQKAQDEMARMFEQLNVNETETTTETKDEEEDNDEQAEDIDVVQNELFMTWFGTQQSEAADVQFERLVDQVLRETEEEKKQQQNQNRNK